MEFSCTLASSWYRSVFLFFFFFSFFLTAVFLVKRASLSEKSVAGLLQLGRNQHGEMHFMPWVQISTSKQVKWNEESKQWRRQASTQASKGREYISVISYGWYFSFLYQKPDIHSELIHLHRRIANPGIVLQSVAGKVNRVEQRKRRYGQWE